MYIGRITLTVAGDDTGPFNIYSNVDGFLSAFETNISKVDLLAGYFSENIPDGTTEVRIMSVNDICNNYIEVEGVPLTTTTTTTVI